jgi:hypothetical protein
MTPATLFVALVAAFFARLLLFVALVIGRFFALTTSIRHTCYCSFSSCLLFLLFALVAFSFFTLFVSPFCTCCFFPSSHLLFLLFVFVASPRHTCFCSSLRACCFFIVILLSEMLKYHIGIWHLIFIIF